MKRVIPVMVMLVAVASLTPAQEVEQRDFGAAARSQQFQERVEMFRQMGMEEEEATFFAMLTSGEMDASQALLLMMMMGDGGGGDDAFGLLMLMNAMKQSQGAAQPVVIDRDGVLLIVEGGVLYKINPETMEVLGQLSYADRGMGSDQLVGLLLPMIERQREQARQSSCLSNLKQIGLAALMYAQDHDEKLPPAAWVGELQVYMKNSAILRCPSRPDLEVGYAMNEKLVGVSLGQIARPAETILCFEMNVDVPSPVGGPDIVPEGGIHNGGINVGYADGHCKWLPWEEARRQLERPPF